MHQQRYHDLKVASETTGKKLRREADLDNDVVFAGLTSRKLGAGSTTSIDGEDARRRVHPPRSAFTMQPRMQNFIARERREILYLFGRDSNWHCYLSASRREREEPGD